MCRILNAEAMSNTPATMIPEAISNLYKDTPEPFFSTTCNGVGLVVHECDFDGLNVGYEDGEWRYADFSEYLMEWIPEFALCASDYKKIEGKSARFFLRRAAQRVYQTKKTSNRGEIGEILLHALIRELYHSVPAISKIYFKTSSNDTVKGFDAVHIVSRDGDFELWLGEVKFYTDIHSAIRNVISELKKHTQTDYLRNEFVLIEDKIDDSWKDAEAFHQLLSQRKSLDEIFTNLRFPVLLTYESQTVQDATTITEAFINLLVSELQNHHLDFTNTLNRLCPRKLSVHLFLLPLANKTKLIEAFDKKLKGMNS